MLTNPHLPSWQQRAGSLIVESVAGIHFDSCRCALLASFCRDAGSSAGDCEHTFLCEAICLAQPVPAAPGCGRAACTTSPGCPSPAKLAGSPTASRDAALSVVQITSSIYPGGRVRQGRKPLPAVDVRRRRLCIVAARRAVVVPRPLRRLLARRDDARDGPDAEGLGFPRGGRAAGEGGAGGRAPVHHHAAAGVRPLPGVPPAPSSRGGAGRGRVLPWGHGQQRGDVHRWRRRGAERGHDPHQHRIGRGRHAVSDAGTGRHARPHRRLGAVERHRGRGAPADRAGTAPQHHRAKDHRIHLHRRAAPRHPRHRPHHLQRDCQQRSRRSLRRPCSDGCPAAAARGWVPAGLPPVEGAGAGRAHVPHQLHRGRHAELDAGRRAIHRAHRPPGRRAMRHLRMRALAHGELPGQCMEGTRREQRAGTRKPFGWTRIGRGLSWWCNERVCLSVVIVSVVNMTAARSSLFSIHNDVGRVANICTLVALASLAHHGSALPAQCGVLMKLPC